MYSKEAVCSCISTRSFLYTCRIDLSNISKVHYTDKNNKKLVQMSCTSYIVYTFHLSLHHANFGQFKAKQVLYFDFSRAIIIIFLLTI